MKKLFYFVAGALLLASPSFAFALTQAECNAQISDNTVNPDSPIDPSCAQYSSSGGLIPTGQQQPSTGLVPTGQQQPSGGTGLINPLTGGTDLMKFLLAILHFFTLTHCVQK